MMKEIDNLRRISAKKGNYLAADAAAQRLLELKVRIPLHNHNGMNTGI
jgi:hypothetical protein